MALCAGIRRVFGLFYLVFDVTVQFSLEAGFNMLELDVLSKGRSSLICGGECLDLKPYDSFVVESVLFRK